jgi:hypothetical protein
MAGAATNSTSQIARTRDPSKIIEVRVPEDFGPEVTVAGVVRRQLLPGARYEVHGTVSMPRLYVPKTVTPGQFEVIVIGVIGGATLLVDGDDTPHVWGRDIAALQIERVSIVDVSNAGAGRGTVMYDLVGGNGQLSVMILRDVGHVGFKALARTVDIGLFFGTSTPDIVVSSGWVSRFTAAAAAAGNSHLIGPRRFDGAAFLPDNAAASLVFIGDVPSVTILGNGVSLGKATNSFIHIDSGTTTGSYSITGQNYAGPSAGSFFRPDLITAITSQVDASIPITSFADSTANPGVDTTVNFGAVVDFTRGQVVLIADELAYDGLHEIVRVADDQTSFDINVVHSTSGPGTLAMVEHVMAASRYVRDETVTITGAPNYNGTFQTLRTTDTSFFAPQAFAGNDATGTATSSGRDQTSPGVLCTANGAQEDSTVLGETCWNGNASSTSVANGAYGALVLTGAMLAPGEERVSLVDAASGRMRYDGEAPIRLALAFLLFSEKAGASAALYRITVSINGVVPVFATAPYAPLELRDTNRQLAYTPTVQLSPGDEIQPMIAGDPDTAAVTFTDGQILLRT